MRYKNTPAITPYHRSCQRERKGGLPCYIEVANQKMLLICNDPVSCLGKHSQTNIDLLIWALNQKTLIYCFGRQIPVFSLGTRSSSTYFLGRLLLTYTLIMNMSAQLNIFVPSLGPESWDCQAVYTHIVYTHTVSEPGFNCTRRTWRAGEQ